MTTSLYPQGPQPRKKRGTATLMFIAFGLFVGAGLSALLSRTGKLGPFDMPGYEGDYPLLDAAMPAMVIAAVVLVVVALLRHIFVWAQEKRMEYPEGRADQVAHASASLGLMFLLFAVAGALVFVASYWILDW